MTGFIGWTNSIPIIKQVYDYVINMNKIKPDKFSKVKPKRYDYEMGE